MHSPFVPCDFLLPCHGRVRADCSVLPVFLNEPGTVDSSLTQTHVRTAHSLLHAPRQNSPRSVAIKAPLPLGSRSRSAALNLNSAHLQPLFHRPFPPPHRHSSPNLSPRPPTASSLQLHSGLHDNTLWREPLAPRAAKTVSICSIITAL